MKNPLKSCHHFCWVHRVYGSQNDRLDLRNNEFLTVLKTMHPSQRYLRFFNLIFYLFCKFLRLQCIVLKTIKNSLFLRSSRGLERGLTKGYWVLWCYEQLSLNKFFFDSGEKGATEKSWKRMMEIVATNVIASPPPNGDRLHRRPLVPIMQHIFCKNNSVQNLYAWV